MFIGVQVYRSITGVQVYRSSTVFQWYKYCICVSGFKSITELQWVQELYGCTEVARGYMCTGIIQEFKSGTGL